VRPDRHDDRPAFRRQRVVHKSKLILAALSLLLAVLAVID
jgi:hypothetical protein